MSYDVSLTMDAGGRTPMSVEVGNYTSNVSHILTRALGGKNLAELGGERAADVLPLVSEAVETLHDHLDEARRENPSNGWGTADGALDFLAQIRDACRAYPNATLRVYA